MGLCLFIIHHPTRSSIPLVVDGALPRHIHQLVMRLRSREVGTQRGPVAGYSKLLHNDTSVLRIHLIHAMPCHAAVHPTFWFFTRHVYLPTATSPSHSFDQVDRARRNIGSYRAALEVCLPVAMHAIVRCGALTVYGT